GGHPRGGGRAQGGQRVPPRHDQGGGHGRPQREAPLHRQVRKIQHPKGDVYTESQDPVDEALLDGPAQRIPAQRRHPPKPPAAPAAPAPPRRAARQSMTRAALASRSSGMVTPMRWAALKLTTRLI